MLAFALLDKDGRVLLFLDDAGRRMDFELPNTKILSLNELPKTLRNIAKTKQIIYLDPAHASIAAVHDLGKNIQFGTDIIAEFKAVKNPTEVRGFKKAHIIDGLAMTKMLYWFFNNNIANLDEFSVCEIIDTFRAESQDFVFPSFPSIVGYADNGAIIHYQPKMETAKTIGSDAFVLIDSGGHYFYGTLIYTHFTFGQSY